ncbi:RCC1 domain-containing protein [Corallococcus exiguus]|uniref:RCC1 domain-containing protein n=1 Tax=Corallococcus exiguus TaxID=83462 RepID=UPI001F5EBFFC|nr:PKD domain-containing protein [Corallococcus exiguus]
MQRCSRIGLAVLALSLVLTGCRGQPEAGANASEAMTRPRDFSAGLGFFNSWPELMGATAMPSSVEVGQAAQVTAYASDPDGDDLSYEWTASCPGIWADATSASPSFTPSAPRPPEGTCTLTVVVRDGRGGQATDSLVLSVSGPSCVPTTCAEAGHHCGPLPDGCGGTLECGACGSGDACNDAVCNPTTGTCEFTPKPICSAPLLLAVGNGHSFASKQDGTVWAWGANHERQLGVETNDYRYTAVPVQVTALTGVTAISAGLDYAVALNQDGTVLAWGSDFAGQSGDGTGGGGTRTPTPTLVPGVTNVASISAGYNHVLALKQDGTVWAWGYNAHGGTGDQTSRLVSPPVEVLGLAGVRAVEAGDSHSLALKQDGTLWAWGKNDVGQLGDGTTTRRLTPVQVQGLTGVIAVSAGYSLTLALRHDGTVWAWGDNSYGQLGDGTNTGRLLPAQVPGLTGVKAVSADFETALAIKHDGTVWAWGANLFGQLGDGTTQNRSVPMPVPSLTGVLSIASGSHVLARKQDGNLWALGFNCWGQIGDGTQTDRYTPVQVQGL